MSNDIIPKIQRRLKTLSVAHSVIRTNPLFQFFSYQWRYRKPNKFDATHNVLIVGCSGDIGSGLVKQFSKLGCSVFGTYFRGQIDPSELNPKKVTQLDITNSLSIEAL